MARASAERPLGIADVIKSDILSVPELPEHWYWCRRHERAEHVSQSPTQWSVDPPLIKTECVRIGPFMSEREANRLGDLVSRRGAPGEELSLRPLGMKVES